MLLLINCASLNKQECLNADWQSIGFEDGSRGYSSTRIGNHRKACAKFNVKPDFDLYQQGYSQGARQFCQPRNGYNLGLRGASYGVICPGDLQDRFVMAYREGKEIYRVKSTLNAYQKNLDHLLEVMDANRDEKADLEHQLITGKLSKPQRIAIIKRMRELEKEKDEVSHKIDEHEYQVAQLRENLRMLQLNSGNY
ncbi:MAG: DUF2799 domain-containing protein [Gammaproteobacteria bacterium]|nr:DUF2799 domain-containing protein [Gammaproteobacteria bacterium]